MKEIVRRSIVTSSFIIFPMMIGLAAIADPLVRLLLTDKWLEAVPFLQVFCLTYSLYPIHTANLQAINALGRSDIFLKLEIVKTVISIIILFITIPFGIYAITLGVFFNGVIATFINALPNTKLLNYKYMEQIKDIIPSLSLSLVMGIIVYPIQFFELSAIMTIILQIIVGIISYVGLSILFKLECYQYLMKTLKTMIKQHKIKTI
ncbi:hypothetical protein UACE39S_05387 [Ureibacillus acetophenoni]